MAEITAALIKAGLWTMPGGAWCSSGVPVFDKMSKGRQYPTFKHYNYKCEDVTHFATCLRAICINELIIEA